MFGVVLVEALLDLDGGHEGVFRGLEEDHETVAFEGHRRVVDRAAPLEDRADELAHSDDVGGVLRGGAGGLRDLLLELAIQGGDQNCDFLVLERSENSISVIPELKVVLELVVVLEALH